MAFVSNVVGTCFGGSDADVLMLYISLVFTKPW